MAFDSTGYASLQRFLSYIWIQYLTGDNLGRTLSLLLYIFMLGFLWIEWKDRVKDSLGTRKTPPAPPEECERRHTQATLLRHDLMTTASDLYVFDTKLKIAPDPQANFTPRAMEQYTAVIGDILVSCNLKNLIMEEKSGRSPSFIYKDHKVAIGGIGVVNPIDDRVYDRVLEYLHEWKSYYGIVTPFCLVSTYQHWQVLWLNEEESNEVAQTARPMPSFSATTTNTTATHHFWPNIAAERRVRSRNPTLRDAKLDGRTNDVAGEQCCRSRIFTFDDPEILPFIGSAMIKMAASKLRTAEFDDLNRAVMRVNREGWSWQDLADCDNSFYWDTIAPAPPHSECFLLRLLGAGAEGKVWMACTTTRQLCAIKFQHPQDSGETNAAERLEKELECWKTGQPETGSSVRKIRLNGTNALLMPYIPRFADKSSISTTEQEAVKTAVQALAANGYQHDDLHWRHISFYGDVSKPTAALIDFGLVSKINKKSRAARQKAIREMLDSLDLES